MPVYQNPIRSNRNHESTHTSIYRLVAVHGHSLGVSAKLAVCRWADRTAGVATNSTARLLLESKELFGAEALVVDLRGCFNEILEVGTSKEIAEIDEFAVVLILDW